MAKQNYPDSFASIFKEFERRLRALETAPRMPNTSQRGGTYELITPSGETLFRFGTYQDGQGAERYGVGVYDGNGATVLAVDEATEGMLYPQQYLPLVDPTPKSVTSATFQVLWEVEVSGQAYDVLNLGAAIVCPAGTTGEVRFADSTGTYSTSPLTFSSSGTASFAWIHPFRVGWGDTRSRPDGALMQWQVRRTGGAGTISAYSPRRVVLRSSKQLGILADTAGGGVFA